MDRRTLSEARAVYTISGNVADRLRRFNQVEAEVLYPPPKLDPLYHAGDSGDYIFSIGRLDPLKRFDLLIRAMKHTETPVRCRIAGTGPERENLEALIDRLGLRGEGRAPRLGGRPRPSSSTTRTASASSTPPTTRTTATSPSKPSRPPSR